MIVRENINFERGSDPKKSMRIGRYADYYGKTPRQIAQEIVEYVDKESFGPYQILNYEAMSRGYKNIHVYDSNLYVDEELDETRRIMDIEKAIDKYRQFIYGLLEKMPLIDKESVTDDFLGHYVSDGPPLGTLVTMIESKIDPEIFK